MDTKTYVETIGCQARAAGRELACVSDEQKRAVLATLARLLEQEKQSVLAANARDIEAAAAAGMDAAKLDRLRVTDAVIAGMVTACHEIATLADPVGEIESMWQRPNGLQVGRMRIPLGVIAIIYESRPNVTIDTAILCLKAGNAVILRGGSEAVHSNTILASLLHQALDSCGLPVHAVQYIDRTDRSVVQALLKLDDYIDVIIPRGGESLIRAVVSDATMPVLKHYKGVCHTYVDRVVDEEQALAVVFNAKVQRPGVCNALECLLVHEEVADSFLPAVADRLGKAGVHFRACERSLSLLGKTAAAATASDWGYEFHELVLAVRVVASMEEAQKHIAQYGSHHTEVILTTDHTHAMRFVREVDASLVGVNMSSRFNDGGELGLGAEMGISTSKLHSYGPMGVKELTSTKFICLGTGQVRE